MYAKEIDELLSAYPGRRFTVREFVDYIDPSVSPSVKRIRREQVRRVLIAKEEHGVISSTRGEVSSGQSALYWKAQH